MSPRLILLALLALALASGCGAEPPSGASRFSLELVVEQALADELAAFQVAVLAALPDGRQRDCPELQKRCVRQQVKLDEFLMLHDGKGAEGRALRFPVGLSGAGSGSQDVTIEVPVGRDYDLIIEAISGHTPPRFLGSSCNDLLEVNASRNDPVIAAPMTLNSVDCNPTIL